MLSIFIYTVATAIMFKPVYVGITIGLLILVFETSFIMVWKYQATNFTLQVTVVVPMVVSILTMLIWVIYILMDLVTDDEEPDYFKKATLFTVVAYFVILVGTLLYVEYEGAEHQLNRLTKSFWVLFTFVFLVLFGAGALMIYNDSTLLLGLVWVSTCLYILLNIVLAKFQRIIAMVFASVFVVAGLVILMAAKNSDVSFQGISVFYMGFCILSLGIFMREYGKNKTKKRTSIFTNAPEVFPMLEYNLETRKMTDSNAEPMWFFFFVYCVLMWAFSATIIID